MCGIGDRTCGICANAGFCLCSMDEDEFSLASKEEVKKRLEEGRYPSDTEVMKAYLGISDTQELYRDEQSYTAHFAR